MSVAKARLEEELGKLESLLRLLDEFEHNRQDQKLLVMLSQKLKALVPELRQLSLDPSFKTPECAPLLVTLGQGVKHVQNALSSLRQQGLALPPVHSASTGGSGNVGANGGSSSSDDAVKSSETPLQPDKQELRPAEQRQRGLSSAQRLDETEQQAADRPNPSPRSMLLAEPKPLKGYLKKRGDKGLVKGFKLRYFEQRGDKIMYYFSDKPEDMKQVVGWIDLTKMLSVERSDDSLSFFVRTTGRVYALAVPSGRTDIGDAQAVLNYWVGGLMRWKQYRQDSIERMNRAPPAGQPSPAGQSVSPPKSSVWSGMSVVSDEEDNSQLSYTSSRLSSLSARSSISALEAVSPGESSPVQQPAPQQTTFELSPFESSSAPRQSVAGLRKTNSARKLDFDDAPPVSAASTAPLLLRQKSGEQLGDSPGAAVASRVDELGRLLQQASSRLALAEQQLSAARVQRDAEANEAQKLRDELNRVQETMATLQNDATMQRRREEERCQNLEDELREAKVRRQLVEQELETTRRELRDSQLLLAEQNRTRPQNLVAPELARLASARQPDVVAFLSRELENEKEANEAHQQRVRFLAGQLAQLERSSKAELELKESQLIVMQERVQKLRSELNGSGAAVAVDVKAIEELKREFFQALGVGMKLNLAIQGQSANLDLTSLYEEVRDSLHYSEWNRYLSLKLSLDLQPKKRESITLELAQLFKKNKQREDKV